MLNCARSPRLQPADRWAVAGLIMRMPFRDLRHPKQRTWWPKCDQTFRRTGCKSAC